MYITTISWLLVLITSTHTDAEIVYEPTYASKDYYMYPGYAFKYAVADPHTGDNKAQWETRNGNLVKGAYSLVEPNGKLRIVDYWADEHSGFNAVVNNVDLNLHHEKPILSPTIFPAIPYSPVVPVKTVKAIAPLPPYGPIMPMSPIVKPELTYAPMVFVPPSGPMPVNYPAAVKPLSKSGLPPVMQMAGGNVVFGVKPCQSKVPSTTNRSGAKGSLIINPSLATGPTPIMPVAGVNYPTDTGEKPDLLNGPTPIMPIPGIKCPVGDENGSKPSTPNGGGANPPDNKSPLLSGPTPVMPIDGIDCPYAV